MEEDKNLNQPPAQSPTPEQASSAVPPIPENPKPKFKLLMLIVGLIFLILVGTASAAFVFLPKLDTNQQKQTKAVLTPQPTALQTTSTPSPTPNTTTQLPTTTPDPTAKWATYTYINPGNMFSLEYPTDKWIVQESSKKGLDGGGTVIFALTDDIVFINGSSCLNGKTYDEAIAYQGETLNVGTTIKLISRKTLSLENIKGLLIETEEISGPYSDFKAYVCKFNADGKPIMGFSYVGFSKNGYDKFKQDFLEIIPTYKFIH
jgi:hypothetical protein